MTEIKFTTSQCGNPAHPRCSRLLRRRAGSVPIHPWPPSKCTLASLLESQLRFTGPSPLPVTPLLVVRRNFFALLGHRGPSLRKFIVVLMARSDSWGNPLVSIPLVWFIVDCYSKRIKVREIESLCDYLRLIQTMELNHYTKAFLLLLSTR